jgi:hypothetical protein
MYGYRQALPPDDLPEDFEEEGWDDDDDDECRLLSFQELRSKKRPT